jgi:hypothetical protein
MIKVSVFYPNTGGATFDMDYYLTKHGRSIRCSRTRTGGASMS